MKLDATQNTIIEAIESEIRLIKNLRSKYSLGFKLYEREIELLNDELEVTSNRFLLERVDLSSTCQLWHVYFKDGTVFSCRVPVEQKMRLIV